MIEQGHDDERGALGAAQWRRRARQGYTLVTGGAGFIGSNLAHRLLESGHRVMLYDNLSRAGVDANAAWLKSRHGSLVELVIGDTRDRNALRAAVAGAEQVFHFAAQVAVTSSLDDPALDFAVNARGTLNLLEELRRLPRPPSLVFTSTNKVYGALSDLALREADTRYEPCDERLSAVGIDEQRPLDFQSPYGCSKGAADQYVLDYARTFGLPTVVFRMSCIYGPRQFGTEDQGWVAHFLMRALAGQPIVVYGDGKQVRDALYVDDLVDALLLGQRHVERLGGTAFNIGGGPANTLSLLELLDRIAELCGRRPEVEHAPWRPGDQRYYVSDTRAFQVAAGWAPTVGVRPGVERLCRWILAVLPGHQTRLSMGLVAQ